jgi:hypothetical protein
MPRSPKAKKGVNVPTTFEQDKYERIAFVARKLHLTPQQFIRQAVDQELLKYDVFQLAGGTLPSAEVPDQNHYHSTERQRSERGVAEKPFQGLAL